MRGTVVLFSLVGGLAVLAGCVGQVEPDTRYALNGTFEESATSSDQQAFFDRVDEHGGKGAVFTSLPAGFHVSELDREGCQQLEHELASASYVAQMTGCRAYEP